ncbi:hypothetical protein [Spiroplasma endosymbiont of Acasis viretata]
MFNKLKEKFKNRKCKTGSCENKNKPVAKSEFENKNETEHK